MANQENATNLPNAIRLELSRRGMTQGELADMLGVSRKVVSHWLNGKSVPAPGSLDALVRVLGIDLEEINPIQASSLQPQSGPPRGIILEPFMAQRLEHRRMNAGLTISELGRRAESNDRTVRSVLRGSAKIVQRRTLEKIANAMDFSLEDILRRPTRISRPVPDLPTQTRSAHFTIRNGLVAVVPTQEIEPDENDYHRLAALQTPLLQASRTAEAELSKDNKPFAALLEVTKRYLEELDKDTREINYAVLYAYGLHLAVAYESAEKLIEKGELPDFNIDALTSTRSVLRLHGPFILSSKDGRDLVVDAERYERNPPEERQYQADVERFGKILQVRDDLVEKKAAEFISEITAPDDGSRQFERRYIFTKGAAKNLVIVFSAGALVASAAFIPVVGPVVAASLGLLTIEAMKKSKPFNDLSAPIRRGLDDLSDIDLVSLQKIPQEAVEKMRKFVIENRDILQRVGGSAREMQWFRDVLNWVAPTPLGGIGSIARKSDKGFGFISPDGGGTSVFFNAHSVVDNIFDELREGDLVTYEIEDGPKGPAATNVRRA